MYSEYIPISYYSHVWFIFKDGLEDSGDDEIIIDPELLPDIQGGINEIKIELLQAKRKI